MITILLIIIIVILLMQSEGGRSCLGALAILIGAVVLFTLLAVSA
jgi:hypothetical protein